jgi:type I restriction enzyme M protein
VYEGDTYGRFIYGTPPASSADWGWAQHVFASLKENGKMAMVIDTGAVSHGSGNQGASRERDIRKAFVENDFVEAVILLPENLFYNTTAPGNILLLSKRKAHPGEILLINASQRFAKGRPKNYLTDEDVAAIAGAYRQWQAVEGFAAIITREETARNDYNLSPSRYVSSNNKEEVLPLEEAIVLLEEAEEERAQADRTLNEILQQLGLKNR